jgi:hypothetical protein
MYNLAIKAFFFSQTSEDMEVFILMEVERGQITSNRSRSTRKEYGWKGGRGGEELSREGKVETEDPGRRE